MGLKSINAAMLQKMFLSGAGALEQRKEYINELNVFPVPDGDTGTNMSTTINAAAKEVAALKNPTIEQLSKSISGGSLRGARGNSGVIMSQIFRGFVKSVRELEAGEIDAAALANAMKNAADTAYKAVLKPKEGTILTVARAGADKALEMSADNEKTDDIVEFCAEIIASMEDALSKTPEMLFELKQAGVVDSGGEGLVTFLRGAGAALRGEALDFNISPPQSASGVGGEKKSAADVDIKFGYCTEYIIMLERGGKDVEAQLKEYLQKIGDCVVAIADDGIVKVHVHTNDPGLAIQKALTYGSLTSVKIDNMREEHNEKVIRNAQKYAIDGGIEDGDGRNLDEPAKEAGFVAVSSGEGLSAIFHDLKADYIVEGGRTMNPSTEDIVKAIENVNAKNVFVLPNNSNVILAAMQAKELVNGKNVIVVPSQDILQGITALINYSDERTVEDNERLMKEEMLNIKSGQVTYAVKDADVGGRRVRKGEYMGIAGKSVLSVEKTSGGAVKKLVKELVDDQSELICLYYGEGVAKEEARALADELSDVYADIETEVQYGGQPLYSYLVSVE